MRNVSSTSGKSAKSPAPPASKGMWLVTTDEPMRRNICGLLQSLEADVVSITPARSATENPWEWSKTKPEIIVLDIEEDMDWGGRIIDAIHDGGHNVPLVVVTRSFSREFGAKIIPRGMCYYFPHDFYPHEFLEVIRNLVQRRASSPVKE
jgi:CheY-like chemotaxis protein